MKYMIPAVSLYMLLLPTVAIQLSAATVQPEIDPNRLVLSNFQATSTVNIGNDGMSMLFSDFAFSQGIQWGVSGSGEQLARLSLGGGGRLQSTTILEQSIQATASVDYVVGTGYRISKIELFGSAMDSGVSASEGYGINAPYPCTVGIWGSDSFGTRTCNLVNESQQGTIAAWMFMHTDKISNSHLSAVGILQGPTIELTIVHNPEPGTIGMMVIGGVGLLLIKRKIKRRMIS